eukprot:TRINITY_DN15067_c0_g1_i4.p1 TRINITY_DN15067_c0_g1~~TRINITY_DN15067_c0_g1_i4.p1  ORF type:complete len:479 (+),score=89.61 TRINITY_DN15067_c0_g1_i4:188-1624(+)
MATIMISQILLLVLAQTASGSLLRVPLRREIVPVRRKGKVVSNKISFSGSLSVGSPPQVFRVVMDTGSGHLILPSSSCGSKACLLHRQYNVSASTTGTAINADGSQVDGLSDQVTIGFGTGQVLGEFAQEKVCLYRNDTGGEVPERSCVEVRMVTAVEMSEQPFSTFNFDGILGLGLQGLALSPEFSFFEAWASQQGAPGRKEFAFFLTEDEREESELLIGGHDAAQALEPLAWSPVALPEMGFWQLQIKAIRVGGVELDFCRSGDCRGVFDTGTSHLGIPAPFDKELLKLMTLPEASLRSFETSNPDSVDCRLAEAPALQIEVPGMNLTLEPAHYMRKQPLRKDVRLSETSGVSAETSPEPVRRFCRPRLMPVKLPAPLGPKLFLLGEPLLQRYYTVFDWQSQQIGLSLAANRLNQQTQAGRPSKAVSVNKKSQQRTKQVDEIFLLQLPKSTAKLSKILPSQHLQEEDDDAASRPEL